jgi:hypothetical protein
MCALAAASEEHDAVNYRFGVYMLLCLQKKFRGYKPPVPATPTASGRVLNIIRALSFIQLIVTTLAHVLQQQT